MSVGARGVFNQAYSPLLFDVGTVPFPEAGSEQATLDALERYCAADPKPAAFIVEPLILGAGGMLIYGPAILAQMRAICARHGVLFIADEVMTGWGRTGTLFACEQAGIAPDIMCLSKGLTGGAIPLAVTLATAPIYDAHYSQDRAKLFYHSSSYTANPIACAAANANLEIWRDEPVLDRIAALGNEQEKRLSRLDHPAILNKRRIGTITAMEISSPDGNYLSDLGPRLTGYFRNRDLLLRAMGNTVYVMPPYCIDAADLDLIYAAIGEAADQYVKG
jgi:adenosylmethionine-8-amino-7-oxononanoate aminotransferase